MQGFERMLSGLLGMDVNTLKKRAENLVEDMRAHFAELEARIATLEDRADVLEGKTADAPELPAPTEGDAHG